MNVLYASDYKLLTYVPTYKYTYFGKAKNDYVSLFNNNSLSMQQMIFTIKDKVKIIDGRIYNGQSANYLGANPNISVNVLTTGGFGPNLTLSLYNAVMKMLSSTYILKEMYGINNYVITSNIDLNYIHNNTLNAILYNIYNLKDFFQEKSFAGFEYFLKVALYIMVCMCAFICIGGVIIILIINSVKTFSSQVFELFLLIKKNDIDEHMQKCRTFIAKLESREDKEDEDEHNSRNDKVSDQIKKKSVFNKKSVLRKKKNFKGISLKTWKLILSACIAMTLFLAYFVFSYYQTWSFSSKMTAFINEIKSFNGLNVRYMVYLIGTKELVYHNDVSQINMTNGSAYINDLITNFFSYEDKFKSSYQQNLNYHTQKYIDYFQGIETQSLCSNVTAFDATQQECTEFNQGVLLKGRYTLIMKYWDQIRQAYLDYKNQLSSNNTANMIAAKEFYTSDEIIESEEALFTYIMPLMEQIEENLNDDILQFITDNDRTILCLVVVLIIYSFMCSSLLLIKIIKDILFELWRSKSVLSILSPELIMGIQKIKSFIESNSSFAQNSK